MVAVLIKRLHPTAQRIDGSGGDGGRNVQVLTDDGLLIYEPKSFTGRLSVGDRITDSVTRAVCGLVRTTTLVRSGRR